MTGAIHLLLHECLGHSANRALGLLGSTFAALSLLAVNVGLQQVEIETAQARHYQQERDLDRKAPVLNGRQPGAALRVVRPSVPGTALVRGLGRTAPVYWEPTAAGLVEGPVSASVDRRSEVGSLFDFEGVTRVVLGLFALLVGVRSVSSHRSDHTLQTLLDLPISRLTLALVKLAGALLTAAVLVTLVYGGVLALVWLRARHLLATELPLIAAVASAVAFGYALILIAVGMVVGSLARTATAAGSVGIAIWGTLTLAYPQVVQLGAHAMAPLPLRAVVEDEQQKMYTSRLESTVVLMGETGARLAPDAIAAGSLPDTREIRAALNDIWQADAADTRVIINAIHERARLESARHERLSRLLALMNPAMLFNRILGAAAATGAATATQWDDALFQYQARCAQEYFDDPARIVVLIPAESGAGRIQFTRKRLPTFAELPQFEPPTRDLRGRLYDARMDLALLAAFMLVTSILAVACFPSSGS